MRKDEASGEKRETEIHREREKEAMREIKREVGLEKKGTYSYLDSWVTMISR